MGKSPGAQNGRKGNGFKLMKEPDETIQYYPGQCEGCPNFGLCKVCGISETKYDVDICVETKVTAHQVLSYECPNKNNKVISGSFPTNIRSTLQYGDNLEALVIALNTSGMMGIKHTHDILSADFGIPISAGTIFSMVKECGLKPKDAAERIRQTICDLPRFTLMKRDYVLTKNYTGFMVFLMDCSRIYQLKKNEVILVWISVVYFLIFLV